MEFGDYDSNLLQSKNHLVSDNSGQFDVPARKMAVTSKFATRNVQEVMQTPLFNIKTKQFESDYESPLMSVRDQDDKEVELTTWHPGQVEQLNHINIGLF